MDHVHGLQVPPGMAPGVSVFGCVDVSSPPSPPSSVRVLPHQDCHPLLPLCRFASSAVMRLWKSASASSAV